MGGALGAVQKMGGPFSGRAPLSPIAPPIWAVEKWKHGNRRCAKLSVPPESLFFVLDFCEFRPGEVSISVLEITVFLPGLLKGSQCPPPEGLDGGSACRAS